MKAIFIDAAAREVREIDINEFNDLYTIIGCDLVQPVDLNPQVCLYLDEEGKLKENNDYFTLKGYPSPLAGNGVLVRQVIDDEGEDHFKDIDIPVSEVSNLIEFTKLRAVYKGTEVTELSEGTSIIHQDFEYIKFKET